MILYIALTFISILIFLLIRNEVVYHARINAIKDIDHGLYFSEKLDVIEKKSQYLHLFIITKWTKKQFFPELYND